MISLAATADVLGKLESMVFLWRCYAHTHGHHVQVGGRGFSLIFLLFTYFFILSDRFYIFFVLPAVRNVAGRIFSFWIGIQSHCPKNAISYQNNCCLPPVAICWRVIRWTGASRPPPFPGPRRSSLCLWACGGTPGYQIGISLPCVRLRIRGGPNQTQRMRTRIHSLCFLPFCPLAP